MEWIDGGRTVLGAPGSYALGFTDPLSGNLREIHLEARRIAALASLRRHAERTRTSRRYSWHPRQ